MSEQNNVTGREVVTIKILKAEGRYGLRRGEVLTVEVVKREARYTVFFQPPMRHLSLYNEDFKEIEKP